MTERILIVDDEESIRRSLEIIFDGAGYPAFSVGSGEEAVEVIAEGDADVVFLDLQLPGIDGIDVLRQARAEPGAPPIVIISGHATIERAVEATRLGAFDVVEKPFSRDRVLLLARNAAESARLAREVRKLRGGEEPEIVGESPAIQELRDAIARVAASDARVLILGESGTGKELVATALHGASPRASRPFIRVNCAAIPEELIEAELFGAVKGAYTGATRSRDGRFKAADGGTLFLDEIGDMSLAAQAKVLRVLQEGEYEPVGSTTTVSVDVRVIAATHRDLAKAAAEGRFREDLLYRLNVIPLEVPPLRDRRGDVRILGERFLLTEATRHEVTPPTLGEPAWAALEAHRWPGNIRELKNLIERLVILHPGARVDRLDLGGDPLGAGGGARATTSTAASAGAGGSAAGARSAGGEGASAGSGGDASPHAAYQHLPIREARDALERDLIRAALERHHDNVTRAAAELGIERTHLHKRIRMLGIRG